MAMASKAAGEVATGGQRWQGNDGQGSTGGNEESADGDGNDERGWARWCGAGRRRVGARAWTVCWKHLIGCCQKMVRFRTIFFLKELKI